MKIKLLELFGGIGSIRKALENLGFDIEIIDYVDNWKVAVNIYNKIFNENFQPKDINTWKVQEDKKVDILMHGSPCQDFSNAGKNDLSSGRSILYRKTLEIVNQYINKPKIVIWENVKGLINKKNIEHFNFYLNKMEKMGYINHYKVLNSLNFGIPQTRERIFVISIHKNYLNEFKHFNFDNLQTNKYEPLKNFFDNDVDEKYYIKQKSMVGAIESGKVKIIGNIVYCITTKQWRWNNSGVVKVSLHKKEFYQTDKVYKSNEKIGTIGTKKENNRIAISLIEINKKFEYIMSDNTKRNIGKIINGKVTIPITKNHTSNVIGIEKIPTLKTQNQKILVEVFDCDSKDFSNFKIIPRQSDGQLINGSYNRMWKDDKYVGTISSSKQEKILNSLEQININGNIPIFIIENKPYYLRILTERECWKLMGWNDCDIDKIIKMPSNHLYKTIGNAIVINILESILRLLFKVNGKIN